MEPSGWQQSTAWSQWRTEVMLFYTSPGSLRAPGLAYYCAVSLINSASVQTSQSTMVLEGLH
eukprot:1141767-Pelagomonas_calceolata.AAC.3